MKALWHSILPLELADLTNLTMCSHVLFAEPGDLATIREFILDENLKESFDFYYNFKIKATPSKAAELASRLKLGNGRHSKEREFGVC